MKDPPTQIPVFSISFLIGDNIVVVDFIIDEVVRAVFM